MKNKEQGGFNFKGVITAVMAGALVGYMLYESGVVDKVIETERQQRIELCGPKLDHCPTYDAPIGSGITW